MLFKTSKGMYQLKRNYRDAFNLEAFMDKYIEECMDKYPYIVGDISSGILRLKGFDADPKSKNYYGYIDDYLDLSCAFGCPFYVLKRIKSKEEYEKLEKINAPILEEEPRVVIGSLEKENFDKESLVLKSTPKAKRKIVIDSTKINTIPKGNVPDDIREIIESENQTQVKPKAPEALVETQTYVSASPDFDPSKKENNHKNRNRGNNNPKKKNKNKNKNN